MRDDDTRPTDALDPDARTASHDHVNQPGMTNGIPDDIEQDVSKSYPHSEREKSESAGGGARGDAAGSRAAGSGAAANQAAGSGPDGGGAAS